MQTSIRSARGRDHAHRTKALAGLVVTLAVLVAASPAAWAAGIMEDTYTFAFEQANPAWDTTYNFSFDLPRFDTQGGARQLLGYTVSYYTPALDYWWHTNPNPTADYVCAELDWQFSFAAQGPSGEPWFPLDQDPPYLVNGEGRGVGRDVFWPGEDPKHRVAPLPEDPSYFEVTGDPADLATVIGTGAIAMTAEINLSELVYADPSTNPMFPPPPSGEWVYDPDLLAITPELLHAQLQVTYHYTPEPGSLLLVLGLGALGGFRRR